MATQVTLILGLLIITAAVYAIIRKVDVRLALLLAALALGTMAGDPMAIVRTFLTTLTKEQFIIPICCAIGFAYVLRHTGCDQHLVHLLVEPLRRVRVFLVPGTVLVGFLVNIPMVSQTSTAVAIGSVLVPLLLAARVSPVTAGAALLLGSSIGGELLNPAAPELGTISNALNVLPTDCVGRVLPLLLLHLGVATAVFWAFSLSAEAKHQKAQEAPVPEAGKPAPEPPPFRVNLLKAAVPLLPLSILFVTTPPFGLISLEQTWLVDPPDPVIFNRRLIGAAMLVGVAVAALTAGKAALGTAKAFFDGAGYGFTHPIALIVVAECFGEGIRLIGLANLLGTLIATLPGLLIPTAAALPLAFAVLSGSGMASTQSLFRFFTEPSQALGIDPVHVGAVVSIGSAAGRTMSPVSAVTLMCATLTDTNPIDLVRRVALPLLAGMVAVVIAGAVLAPAG